MMSFRPKLLAFNLPGMPRRDAEEACQVMICNFPEVVTVPRPTMSQRMWTEGVPCINIDKEKKRVTFDLSSGRESELVEVYDRYLSQDLDYFAIRPELDPSLYKLAEIFKKKPWPELKLIHFMFAGLYAWALSVKDEKSGTPALYNETMRDVLIKVLVMKARWYERKIKELFPGVQTMATVGDGALGVYSTIGGTDTRADIIRDYNAEVEAVEGITCIHCCSNFDWSLLMETNTDVINFDAYQYGNTMSLYHNELRRFLGRGGMIAWGIVPTMGGGNIEDENPSSLVERLEGHIQSLVDMGIDKETLLESSWITPTCETSAMSIDLSDRVYDVTREVSQRMRKKYFG